MKKNQRSKRKPVRFNAKPPVKNETTRLGAALRTLGGLGGGALGNLVGMGPAGSSTGHSMGAALSKWLGSGDYEISNNSVVSKLSAGIPMMHTNGQSIVVRHKEFIGDIVAGSGTPTTFSTAFTIPLNPGLESSFPWLSAIASQFQEYNWKGLVFHYVPTSGESVASTNTSLGTVMMSTNYRATDLPFFNKQQVLNEYFSSDSKPSDSFVHPIECDPKENPYNIMYTRTGAIPSGEDQKTYDLGVMRVNTVGNPSPGAILGELWVTYEVELKKPKPSSLDSLDSGIAHFYNELVITGNVFGGTHTSIVNSLGLTVTSSSLSFPQGTYGTYLILIYIKIPSTSVNTSMTLTYNNCTAKSLNLNGTNDFAGFTNYSAITGGAGYAMFSTLVRIDNTASVASVVFGSFAITGGLGTGDLIVTQVSTAFA